MRRDPRVVWRSAPGHLVLGLPHQPPIIVDGPGADVWNALALPCTEDELVTLLASQYRTAPEVVRYGVTALIDRLVAEGFVSGDR